MKKNLLSILILALLIVNIVLTSIMMFSVVGTSKRTSALVSDIASVLNLELSGTGAETETEAEAVPMSQTAFYNITEEMTISLKNSDDGSKHFLLLSAALSMNTKDKGYKKYGGEESMTSAEPMIKSEIVNVISSYTMEQLKDENKIIDAKNEIISRIRKIYDSDFIFDISFSDITYS